MTERAQKKQPLYRIRNWDKHFENNRTRDIKHLRYVMIPNKQDGAGYGTMIEAKDGPALFGAWTAVLQIASKCEPRGCLQGDDKVPLTPHLMAVKCRIPAPLISRMIEVAVSIGWMEVCDNPAPCGSNPAPSCGKAPLTKPKEDLNQNQNQNQKGSPGGLGVFPFSICFPKELDTPAVHEAMDRWIEYKRKRKQAYLDGEGPTSLLHEYDSADEFVRAVNSSIGNNYSGLYRAQKACSDKGDAIERFKKKHGRAS